jgi:NAD(P)H-nitrite reductase large subunit
VGLFLRAFNLTRPFTHPSSTWTKHPMAVTRCICHDVPFSKLKELSTSLGPDIDALMRETGCGTGCGMCVPYILFMLQTGKTSVPILTKAQIESLMQQR